jgi:3-phenylpropionate/trans-cinnamate dioxygenase ferredoxin reductase subunit
MMQYVGYHGGAESLVWRGDPAEPTWAVCWLAAGRLVAMLTVDRPRDLLQGRRLIASADPVDVARLTDPAVPVKAATAAR